MSDTCPTKSPQNVGLEKRREEKNIKTPPIPRTKPLAEECESFAKRYHPKNPEFAASVARQFHGIFELKNWMTQNGEDLARGLLWQHRLKTMIEEEARKQIGKTPPNKPEAPPPNTSRRPGTTINEEDFKP
jgi:hypothetical protein